MTDENSEPGGAGETDADRGQYRELAAQYAQRAVRLLEGKPGQERVGRTDPERDPAEAARIYVSIADVYARLAGC